MNKVQQLMAARMGLYKSGVNDVDGLSAILQHQGGYPQQDRMIKDKYRSFLKALQYSYQGANILPLGNEEENQEQFRALINPDKLKQDYDDKIISVDYKYDLKPGSVFNWVNTGTNWLIYLQDLTELAYFRGDIRKCNYTISWKDENGDIQTTYAAIRGPVETKINYIQKNGISLDTPNYSLNILMPKTEIALKYFKRYAEFYLKEDQTICWRVETIDPVSMPGILEITAVEYYRNDDEDSEGIVGNLIVEEALPEDAETSEIKGEIFIKPKVTYKYSYEKSDVGEWSIVEKVPVTLQVIDTHNVKLKWNQTYSGQFTLKCGEHTKTIVVESLF